MFNFLYIYSHWLLSDNVDIYTSTLILCNLYSLNYILIDTMCTLGTMVHLLIFYHPSELYGQRDICASVVWYCINSWYVNTCYQESILDPWCYICPNYIPEFLKLFVCLIMLIHFTGAKFLRNYLKATGDMAIFILLCNITHSIMHACKHAHNRIIIHQQRSQHSLTVRRHCCCSFI